jgi:hypothetical protein
MQEGVSSEEKAHSETATAKEEDEKTFGNTNTSTNDKTGQTKRRTT